MSSDTNAKHLMLVSYTNVLSTSPETVMIFFSFEREKHITDFEIVEPSNRTLYNSFKKSMTREREINLRIFNKD